MHTLYSSTCFRGDQRLTSLISTVKLNMCNSEVCYGNFHVLCYSTMQESEQ
uniref:Uncharacterized protein n=1 Tax=Arundo donax TaxID=35708 RepID=A0A0A9HLZ9_ARUDO